MHIGQKIRLLRVSQRMTQQQLAEKIHKERPLISHIERTGKIHHQTFVDICKALKVSSEQLEFASDEPFGGYASGVNSELKLLKTENERLKNELKLASNCSIEIGTRLRFSPFLPDRFSIPPCWW